MRADVALSTRINRSSVLCCKCFITLQSVELHASNRRNSNRRKECLSKKGTKQATRTVHGLACFHGPSLTKNPIIHRIVRRSADRRIKRFDKEGRKHKVLMKWTKDPGAAKDNTLLDTDCPMDMTSDTAVEASSVATHVLVPAIETAKKKRRPQGLSAKQLTLQKKAQKAEKLEKSLRKGKTNKRK